MVTTFSTLQVDAVIFTRSGTLDGRELIGALRCLNVGGKDDADGRINVHIGKHDVEAARVGGD